MVGALWWPEAGHGGHLSILIQDLCVFSCFQAPSFFSPSRPSSSDLVRCSVHFPRAPVTAVVSELLTRRAAPLMTRRNTITNACFSYAFLMQTAEQITYLWIMRSGGEIRGRHDAISDAGRYEGPICPSICTAGGAPGPGGAGKRLLAPGSTLLSYSTNYRSE